MSLVVLGGSVSPFVRKVRVVLAEKGLDYEHEPVNPFAPPEGWREISPLGRIPAFKDGDRVINDSSVICQYVERRFP
jgi:glutathione S-transferase